MWKLSIFSVNSKSETCISIISNKLSFELFMFNLFFTIFSNSSFIPVLRRSTVCLYGSVLLADFLFINKNTHITCNPFGDCNLHVICWHSSMRKNTLSLPPSLSLPISLPPNCFLTLPPPYFVTFFPTKILINLIYFFSWHSFSQCLILVIWLTWGKNARYLSS